HRLNSVASSDGVTQPSGGAAPREPRPKVMPPAPARSRFAQVRAGTGDFLRRVYQKADQDQIFFMGGAIAFNVLVAIVPLALAAIGVAGFFLQARSDGANPAEPVVLYLLEVLPPVGEEFEAEMRERFNEFVRNAGDLFTIGT